jgi:predicted nucleic acid-binding protein
MKEVFADTFYFIALLSQSDSGHQRAISITAAQRSTLVTTAWVLTELANSLAKQGSRSGFLSTLDALASNPMALVIGHDERLYDAGIELYRLRPDKDWPLTDCISFVVMAKRGISAALTADRHFEQAGFTALLKP